AGRRKLFYGWWMLAASVAVMTVISGLAVWANGLYVRPLEEEFGWSRAQVSLGFSAAILIAGFAGPLIGLWIDRFGPRSAMLVGSTMTGVTYVLLAMTETLWQWYLFAAINAGFRRMTFFIPMQVLASRWFDKRRGAALSILGTGFALGGFLLLPLIALVIDVTDWRGGFMFSGALAVGCVVPITLFVLKDWPSDKGTYADGVPPAEPTTIEAQHTSPGLTLAQAVRQPLFWVLSIALMLFFFGLIGWTVHIVPFFESRGISRETAALLVSGTSGAGIITRLLIGMIADRFRRFEAASALLTSMLVLGMVSVLLDSGWLGIGLFLTFWLIGTSAGALAESLTLTRAFGLAHFATILGVVVVIETCGEILSPSLAGLIFDETGSYDLALVMYACTFTISTALFAVASRMRRPVLDVAKVPAA
ncbi:MAG TPA: MFS transporter, partial [Thermomicrobiales bacterium]|nr:MFS transporter [Thermomicrobiales bacterium]